MRYQKYGEQKLRGGPHSLSEDYSIEGGKRTWAGEYIGLRGSYLKQQVKKVFNTARKKTHVTCYSLRAG